MKKIFLTFTVVSIVLVFGACKKSSSPAPATANVMFVNGCAGTTNVNVSVGTTLLQNASNLGFLKNTGYLAVASGSDSIAFVLANLGTPLVKNGAASLTVSANYSIYAGGLITSPLFVQIADDRSAPSAGNAKIRFVDLCTDALTETAYVGSSAFATGITAGGYSAFTEVTAGNYTIKAGDPSNISTVVSTPSPVSLSSGRIYTVILTGTLLGSGTSGFTLTVINNN